MEQKLKVLIVDDEETDRIAIRRALKSSDVPILFTEARDYGEAIATLDDQMFDCIFVDFNLPDRDGLALVESIHLLNIKSPIVVLTGQGDERIAVKLMKSGVTDYLPKSMISSKTLPQMLRNALRVYQVMMQAELANQRLHESHTQLVRKNQELRLLEHQRQDFIAHLTHDLKTPIIAADMMLKLFHKEAFCPLSADMHTAVTAMIRSNKNLLDIVNTLLEVHSYEAGSKELTPISCDLWEIAQEIVIELKPLADEQGIQLVQLAVEDSDSTEQTKDRFKVMGDYLELRRMLTNLIGNSIKFTDTGFVKVCFSLTTESEAARHLKPPINFSPDASSISLADQVLSDRSLNDLASELVISDRSFADFSIDPAVNTWVLIEVRDSGVGMSKSEQESLFQRFRKGSHKQSGTGLGLHLVQRIVSVHHGAISVASELGKGSLFSIRLPALTKKEE
jgi:two-component system, sensor histidine kinase and response regulator